MNADDLKNAVSLGLAAQGLDRNYQEAGMTDTDTARLAAEARAAAAEKLAGDVVMEALGIVADEATSDEIPGGYIPHESPDWHRGYDAAIRKARAAIAALTKEKPHG